MSESGRGGVVGTAGPPVSRVLGWSRALSGSLAAGVAVLAVSLLLAWGLAWIVEAPGPGLAMPLGHMLGAVAALLLHRTARTRRDRVGLAAALGVWVVLLLLGALYWWS